MFVNTKEHFVEKAKINNPDLDFLETIYTKLENNIDVKCPKHGVFTMKAISFYKHVTCPNCDLEYRTNEFLRRAKEIHGERYNYAKVKYKDKRTPVEIICKVHGSFMQRPEDHWRGYGCSRCSKKHKPTTKEWVESVKNLYGGIYNFSKVKYKDKRQKVCVICPKHGEFWTIPGNFSKEISGCPKCCSERKHEKYKKITEQFIRDAQNLHGNLYDYSQVDYYNKSIPVKIICKKHGEFLQIPNVHLMGYGCKKCLLKSQNKLYKKLCESFKNENIIFETKTPWSGNKRYDIYFPERNMVVEYDGAQHFIPIKKFGGETTLKFTKENDTYKTKLCEDNGCKLFRVKYSYTSDDYNNLVLKIAEEIDAQNHRKAEYVKAKEK